ncbi:hypothetical protein OE88DRAFT_1638506, partial [Heliocybe sulcata]
MPVLVGLEALAIAPPETSRPETSKEFAKRIRKFRLLGPRPSQEGGDPEPGTSNEKPKSSEPVNDGSTGNAESDFRDHANSVCQEVAELVQQHSHLPSIIVDRMDANSGADLFNYISAAGNTSIEDAVHDRYKEDPMFNSILEKPKDYKNFSVSNGLIYLLLQGRRVLCLPDVKHNDRSVREIAISNPHMLLAHLGAQKTLDLLRDHVWWK